MTNKNEIVQTGAKIFRIVYKKNIADYIFEHKHFANPMKMETPYLFEFTDGKAVGMHWMMGQDFAMANKTLYAAQGSDDAVLPEARGKIFSKLRLNAATTMKNEGVDFEFGCFAKGRPLQIAAHFGEDEIVDIYLARLFLKEKTHKWKRFDIRYPEFLSKYLYQKRLKKMRNLRDNDCVITTTHECLLSSADYDKINNNSFLHAIRSRVFYEWKLGKKNPEKIKFVVARKVDELVGFVVLDESEVVPTIIDWDIMGENKVGILASLIYPCMKEYQYIDIPYLNIESGEMELFTKIGCKDMSKLWAPACICVKIINESCEEYVTKPKLWKLRLIDADYYLNT